MLIFTIVSILSWFGGYLITIGAIQSYVHSQGKKEKILAPPRLFFYLCGAPKSNKYPRGAVGEPAFRAQMTGLGLGIYTIVIYMWELSKLEFMIGFFFSVVIPLLISAYVSRNYEINVQSTKNKRE
jgi:hypothetical protein